MIKDSTLSKKELDVISDTDFLLAKAKIMEKLHDQFGHVREELKLIVKSSSFSFPDEVDIQEGKIFKGEYYQDLPYLVLDYPKYFSKTSILTFRTMFWWGNFFSLTLHLKGNPLEKYRQNILGKTNELKGTGTYICKNDTPWEYHYEQDNYVNIDENINGSYEEILQKKEFIKLSRKIQLDEYENFMFFCKETFNIFLSVLR